MASEAEVQQTAGAAPDSCCLDARYGDIVPDRCGFQAVATLVAIQDVQPVRLRGGLAVDGEQVTSVPTS